MGRLDEAAVALRESLRKIRVQPWFMVISAFPCKPWGVSRNPLPSTVRRSDSTAGTQMPPCRRNPKGAWVLRAISALLVVNDVH